MPKKAPVAFKPQPRLARRMSEDVLTLLDKEPGLTRNASKDDGFSKKEYEKSIA
jgi:hypothetical protein